MSCVPCLLCVMLSKEHSGNPITTPPLPLLCDGKCFSPSFGNITLQRKLINLSTINFFISATDFFLLGVIVLPWVLVSTRMPMLQVSLKAICNSFFTWSLSAFQNNSWGGEGRSGEEKHNASQIHTESDLAWHYCLFFPSHFLPQQEPWSSKASILAWGRGRAGNGRNPTCDNCGILFIASLNLMIKHKVIQQCHQDRHIINSYEPHFLS